VSAGTLAFYPLAGMLTHELELIRGTAVKADI